MDRIFSAVRKFCDVTNKIASWLLILYIAMNTGLIIIVVLYRMTGRGVSWAEEMSRWLLVGICFVGSSVALNRGVHVGITAFIDITPKALKRVLIICANVLVMLFILVFIRFSFATALTSSRQMGAIVKVPMTVPYLQMPIGGILMAIQMLPFLIGPFLKREKLEKFMLTQVSFEE
jgi:TRAP-type C4-dicarboxylate transport system permease small subunit